jgi:Zn-dependent peptidase ImmA (M78 family)
MSSTDFLALPRARARKLLEHWDVAEPSDIQLEAIAIERGLVILEKPINGASARLVCTQSGGLIVVDQRIREIGRKRFAAAHEIGHFELHRRKKPMTICTEESFLDWYSQSSVESESNAFAAELLMPEFLFKERCKCDNPSFAVVEKLSDEFQTTLTATAIRFVQVTHHACVLMAGHNGKIRWFTCSGSFPHRVLGKGQELHEYSCAGEFFREGKVSLSPELVPGIAWLEDYKKGERCQLYEDLRVLSSYGTSLSLIWIQDDRNYEDPFRSQNPSGLDPDHFTPDGRRYRW